MTNQMMPDELGRLLPGCTSPFRLLVVSILSEIAA